VLLVCDNEPDDRYDYFVEALLSHLPDARVHDYPAAGGRPSLAGVDAVVLTGSTAGVYEADRRPWIDDAADFVADLVDAGVPTLGVCFGHQLVNAALGGRVEHRGTTARLVDVDLGATPLFDGVGATIPAVHGDRVVAPGDGMRVVASADYYEAFATAHREAPVWTVQYHPEFTADLLPRVRAAFGWTDTDRSFEDVTAVRTFGNFLRLAGCATA